MFKYWQGQKNQMHETDGKRKDGIEQWHFSLIKCILLYILDLIETMELPTSVYLGKLHCLFKICRQIIYPKI